jgi:hypothetical protein
VRDYLAGDPVNLDDVSAADRLSSASGWAHLIVRVAAGIVFLVWLSRARRNAEIICPAPHRRAPGWAIGAWICPVVHLWFPYQVVDDVYRASRPTNSPDLVDLRSVRGSALLRWWWALWLGAVVCYLIAFYTTRAKLTVGSFQVVAVVDTIGNMLMIGAAVLIIAVMREVSRWQTRGSFPTSPHDPMRA